MSLAIDLTDCCDRLLKAERAVSAEVRALKGRVPDATYGRLQAELCVLTSEANRVKITLGVARMTGELDQRPPLVTAERLELAKCVRRDGADLVDGIDVSEPTRRAFAHQLEMIGDDTLREEQAGSLCHDEGRAA